jgi:hypothetical protein
MMAHQAESLERKATSATKPASRTAEQVSAIIDFMGVTSADVA